LFSVDEVAMVQPLADVEDLLVIVFIRLPAREIGLLAIGPVDAVELSAGCRRPDLEAGRYHGIGHHQRPHNLDGGCV
jgi:hypothetical protein